MLITCEVNLYHDKRVLNDVKMVLFMEQFGLEVTSSEFAHHQKGECKINCVRLQQNSSITRLFYDVKRSN